MSDGSFKFVFTFAVIGLISQTDSVPRYSLLYMARLGSVRVAMDYNLINQILPKSQPRIIKIDAVPP